MHFSLLFGMMLKTKHGGWSDELDLTLVSCSRGGCCKGAEFNLGGFFFGVCRCEAVGYL